MKLSRLADYAIRAVVHLASKEDSEERRATISEIAKAQKIPQSFLAKVMQSLTRGGLVIAQRGKTGGFSLAREGSKITVRNIIEAVEGPIIFNRCLVRPGSCEIDTFCGSHFVWIEAQEAIVKVLESHTAADMAKKQTENLTR